MLWLCPERKQNETNFSKWQSQLRWWSLAWLPWKLARRTLWWARQDRLEAHTFLNRSNSKEVTVRIESVWTNLWHESWVKIIGWKLKVGKATKQWDSYDRYDAIAKQSGFGLQSNDLGNFRKAFCQILLTPTQRAKATKNSGQGINTYTTPNYLQQKTKQDKQKQKGTV